MNVTVAEELQPSAAGRAAVGSGSRGGEGHNSRLRGEVVRRAEQREPGRGVGRTTKAANVPTAWARVGRGDGCSNGRASATAGQAGAHAGGRGRAAAA